MTFFRRCGLQNTDHVMPFWLWTACLIFPPFSKEGNMSFVQFKIFYGDNFERCKMHRMKKERFQVITYQEFACEVLKTIEAFLEGKTPRDVRIQNRDDEDTFVNLSCDEDLIAGVYAQWTTPRTCIDYQLECMLLPLQFKLYMLVLRGRSWTSRQSDDVFHQCRENSLIFGILVVSGCLLLFVFPVRTPAEETCILLFRPLCFVPGSEAVFAALVKHIVALPRAFGYFGDF